MKDKDDLIKKAMSELGKRSAKVNKRDYSAMGKKGGWPKGKSRKKNIPSISSNELPASRRVE